MPKAPIPEVFEGLPVVTAEAMKELDRVATQEYGLPVVELMENAGRAVARETLSFLRRCLGREAAQARIVVCCGRGANGGDGLVAARHLREAGAQVAVFLCPPRKEGPAGGGEYPQAVRVNLDRARAAGVPVTRAGPDSGLPQALAQADLVLDALLGTGSSGKPAGAAHHVIQEVTRSKKPVLAVDIPSGLHPDTGYHSGVFITAAATLSLGLPKRGLLAPHALKNVGELKVLDIGFPPELLRRLAPIPGKQL